MADRTQDANLMTLAPLLPRRMVGDAWVADNGLRGDNVALYRRYMDGDFDANMTPEMRQALRLAKGREFGANHCEVVVATMADRLQVTSIKSENPAATLWLQEIADDNRFDGFQMDVHEAVLRDGDSYVMVDWDNAEGRVRWTHEQAYDGIEGMIGVPRSNSSPELVAAVKLWHETRVQYADTLRVTVYLPDEIRRYINLNDGRGLVPYATEGVEAVEPWVDKKGNPLGVPVVHFANRRRGRGGFGLSELRNVVELQDLLNRTAHSMAMTAELTGFGIKWMVGWEPDAEIVPGTIIAISPKDSDGNTRTPTAQEVEWLKAIRFGQYEAADLAPLLAMYEKTENQIAKTTRTPDMASVSDDASGEARKQAEIGLLGKIARFHVKAGNNWEDVAILSTHVHDAFAVQKAPAATRWRTMWKSAAIRNDNDVIGQAAALEKLAGLRAALSHAATVTGWDDAQIEQIIAERELKDEDALEQLVRLAPGYAGRTAPRLNATNGEVADGRDG